jgi:hypothetical protein
MLSLWHYSTISFFDMTFPLPCHLCFPIPIALFSSILSYRVSLPSFLTFSKEPLQFHYLTPIISVEQYLTLKNLLYHGSDGCPHPSWRGVSSNASVTTENNFFHGEVLELTLYQRWGSRNVTMCRREARKSKRRYLVISKKECRINRSADVAREKSRLS